MAVGLEERSRAHTERGLANLVLQRRIAQDFFQLRRFARSARGLREDGGAADIGGTRVELSRKLANAGRSGRMIDLQEHTHVGVIGEELDLVHTGRNLSPLAPLPDVL